MRLRTTAWHDCAGQAPGGFGRSGPGHDAVVFAGACSRCFCLCRSGPRRDAVALAGASLPVMAGCLASLGRGVRRYSGSPLRCLIKRVDLHKSPLPLWEGHRDQGRFPQKHRWPLWESPVGVRLRTTVRCGRGLYRGMPPSQHRRSVKSRRWAPAFCLLGKARTSWATSGPGLSRCVRQSSGAGRPGPSQSLRCRCAVFPRPSHRRPWRRRTIRP